MTYLEAHETVAITTDHGTDGGLTIHVFDGEDYILVDTITTSGSQEIYVRGLTLRFTPSNGMVYSIVLAR